VKPKRRPAPRPSHERWLVSYADFITLLFAFFVVLYSAAEVNQRKVMQVAAAIQSAFQQMGAFPPSASPLPPPPEVPATQPAVTVGSPPPIAAASVEHQEDLSELRHELEAALAPEIARGEVAVHSGAEGLVVSLREIGFFDSGSAGIQAHSQAAFRRMAKLLAAHKFSVRIEGHTDNVPIHNAQFHSNWELSTARATEMVRLLITEYQLPPEQLSAAGYGEYHPTASNQTAEGRAQNRRVDVVILGKQRLTDIAPAPQ